MNITIETKSGDNFTNGRVFLTIADSTTCQQELARAGLAPVVLQDCLRFLALRGLTEKDLFINTAADPRQVLCAKAAYMSGKRPFRNVKAANKDAATAAAVLLLWLHSLPGPLFPSMLVGELLCAFCEAESRPHRLTVTKFLLRRIEPFIVEVLYPLFELLHHYWINQLDRNRSLMSLAHTFAGPVFGYSCKDQDSAIELTAFIIAEYRPVFTQPFNLRRYEEDLAKADDLSASENMPLISAHKLASISVVRPESPASSECSSPQGVSPTYFEHCDVQDIVALLLDNAVSSAFEGHSKQRPISGSPIAIIGGLGDLTDGSGSDSENHYLLAH